MGICRWHGIYTREERTEKPFLIPNLEMALSIVCVLTKKNKKREIYG